MNQVPVLLATPNSRNALVPVSARVSNDALYSDIVMPPKLTDPERRFAELLKDVFSPHTDPDLLAGEQLTVNAAQSKRYVSADSISAVFRSRYLSPFLVSRTANRDLDDFEENRLSGIKEFIDEVADPGFDHTKKPGLLRDSNRICFLIGKVGRGKTLLISKMDRRA